MKIALLMINLALFGLFGWGTFQQISNQQQMNRVMADVHQHIKEAHRLTTITNQQLQPLRETADTIKQMNSKLTSTHQMLSNMNRSLNRVTASEQKIVTGLDHLNRHTSTVLSQLNSLRDQNGQLVPQATALAEQTNTENDYLKTLSRLTSISINELAELNQKFKWLSYLP
ncbi:hypothetical protein [Lihuaxuella thermophila]|uniref:Uncharacterized protein n=1 Tax=Lihuaxuella thermophila TaxID=1173111 RepID=A0A1H8FB50_9BACL|nr:hypothetical protein [Lihuaxuella thermophila]SEN29101.1 hypothetical protein SAMN05444955_108115 [Lihuaxuella thermophila]